MAFDAEKEFNKLAKELKNAQNECRQLDRRVGFLEASQKVLVSVISSEIDKHHKGVAKEISQELQHRDLLIKRDMLFEMRRELKKSK
ncbi:MAG: putative transcriptional regulator [Paracoccaceae bacterium]|jgi:predicted transcriptional regulator